MVVVSVFFISGVVYSCIFVVIVGLSRLRVVLVLSNVLLIFIIISM